MVTPEKRKYFSAILKGMDSYPETKLRKLHKNKNVLDV